MQYVWRQLKERANSYWNTSAYEKDVALTKLKNILILQGLKEEHAIFIIEHGEKFLDRPNILAQKLSIHYLQAKNALNEFKNYKNKNISQDDIQKFEKLVRQNPKNSLEEIALLYDFDESIVSAFLEYLENNPISESKRLAIKEKVDTGFSIPEIADQLRISQKHVREYVEVKCITFSGVEGQRVLEIIARNFGKYPIMKLRELIIMKDVKLQEQICCQLPNINIREDRELKQYFMKFEESQNFFEINETLNILAKECIRNSSLNDLEQLSVKLNRMQRVIRAYLLQYSPDKSLMCYYAQEQLKKIQNVMAIFGMNDLITHSSYRMIISDSFDYLIQKAKQPCKQPKMIMNELLPLVLYYLKCSLQLEEFSQIIAKITNVSLTTLDIFHLIFQMSDPIVRGLCIEHYSFSNPVPLHYPRLKNCCQFEICQELWYSLQQFNGLISFGLGWASWNPIGKSHLLDLTFETDFVKGSPQNSGFHFGSIDIQMTKNLFGNKEKNIHEATEWAYIDCHGYSDFSVITEICQNLDVALIHVTYSDFKENSQLLERDVITITGHAKHVYILVRDHPGNVIKANQEPIRGKSCTIILIPHLINQNKNIRTDLKEMGYEILHATSGSMRSVDDNFLENVIWKFKEGNNLEKEKELIRKIMNYICEKDLRDFSNEQFSSLSYYPYYIEYMSCYYGASNQTEQKIVDELNNKCVVLDEKLKSVKMSKIVCCFKEILARENSTLILWKLSQKLKINAEKYTLEILWREALLSNKYNDIRYSKEASKFTEEYSLGFSNHVERGEPFELIDGDNLRFFNQDIDASLCDFYEKQSHSNNKNKRPPIVISIFGPQSSGKSTLLNYCFGCKFLTSAGRCTKGIYASLSKLSQPINHSDHFLILDTEGLDSIEKVNIVKDTSCLYFDRTMVLFCLAVSQVVIINVKGEIGEEMRNLLQICAYSLNKLKVSKVATPKIFFVLNQQADPDPKKHVNSINILLEDLKRESYLMETEGLTISDLIQVSRENLFVLPSAFNSLCVNTQIAKLFDSDLNKLSPTVSFANKCADLRMSIIQQLKYDESHNSRTPFTTMSEWMEMSGVIWDTIVTYQDIVKYRSVDELKCSISLSKIVNDLLKNKIYFYKDKYRQITEELIKDIKSITLWSPPNGILEIVKNELDEIFKKNEEEALTDFINLCQVDPLLRKMNYMCDDAKSNLCRLIYMEKKLYEDQLRFEIKTRLTEIKLSENQIRFQKYIEQNADKYLELSIEQQETEFDKIWTDCFGSDNKEKDEAERDEMFDNLYSVFRMESKTMENKQIIYTFFRDLNFDMGNIIHTHQNEMLANFCTEPNVFAGMNQYFYSWRENKVPIKEMTSYPGRFECDYLRKSSLWIPSEIHNYSRDRKTRLQFREWVPPNCYSLIQYCSGYYNHPDIIWNPEKRKQILFLASKLRDPNNPERSAWEKFIHDIKDGVMEFIKNDQNISHSTVKEIVNFVCYICKVVNYEINFIEAKLTNAAERTISAYAFAFAFKSILETKAENQRENRSEESKKKKVNLKYFLQKIENRKMARGNWDRIQMRKGDETIANKFAEDLLEAVWRGVVVTCEQTLNEKYFDEKKDLLSHKRLLFLANRKITEKLNTNRKNKITENSFVVQFICNHAQNQRNLFQEEWTIVANELHNRIVGDMKDNFTKEISIIYLILTELLDAIVTQCASLERSKEVGLDSDSNFVADEASTEVSNPRTREAPFKSMVVFLEKYFNPNVNPEEFNSFFSNTFEVDGIKVRKIHNTYILCEKPCNPTHVLGEELFKKLTDVKMFSCTETIFNIKVYIEEFMRTLNFHEFQVTKSDYKRLLKSTKEQFETRVINCPYQCPSCGKFCEREIHPNGGKCKIMTGHQICSMGGKVWKTDKNKTAVLLMCEDYEDHTPVIIPGQNMRWCEFKEKCGDQWDWTLPQDEKYVALQTENREKMKNIWTKFGKIILQYYANRGTHIKYIPYTSTEEIYRSFFSPCSYVCFVIDGTYSMGSTINNVKQWVSDLIRDYEGTSYFKVIVYHGHSLRLDCVDKFPNNSEFTSDEKSIETFLENIEMYSAAENEQAMLHGLATATKGSKWESGFKVLNQIVHFYVEPTKGYFDIFSATGKCNQGCPFDWRKDIRDRMKRFKIEYKSERLINSRHPHFNRGGYVCTDYEIPSVNLNCETENKQKSHIFINYKPDN